MGSSARRGPSRSVGTIAPLYERPYDVRMCPASAPLDFLAAFPDPSAADWYGSVTDTLKGRDIDTLVTRSHSGVAIQPLYDQEGWTVAQHLVGTPGAYPFTRGRSAVTDTGFDLRQRHTLTDPGESNEAILADLEGGVTSILLRVRRTVTGEEMARALTGVLLDMAPVALDAGPWWPSAVAALESVWDERNIDTTARRAALRIDPLGAMARFGAAMPEDLTTVINFGGSPHVTTMAVDVTPYSAGGASASLELGLALATGVEYLRWLTGSGTAVETAARTIDFTYSASPDQFETIAKFRAARRCWARVIGAIDAVAARRPDVGQRQHAVCAEAYWTRTDPWINLLRATTACFAAAVGGAESITVLPFDSAVGVPDELGRRTARNIGLLLMDEAHVARVIDPGGGSWFIEDYTDQLAAEAWKIFQNVESLGGMNAALTRGTIQNIVAADWQNEHERLRRRQSKITGVSEFPNADEEPLARDPQPPLGSFDSDPRLQRIPLRRRSADFDQLRTRARAAVNEQEPQVFVAGMGSPAHHAARVGFANNFFAAGGVLVEQPDPQGYEEPGDAAAAWALSGAPAAVVCSSDAVYEDVGIETAAALKAAGCDRVYLAGNPGEAAGRWRRAGVDAFIHLGSDVVAELGDLHDYLGISVQGNA